MDEEVRFFTWELETLTLDSTEWKKARAYEQPARDNNRETETTLSFGLIWNSSLKSIL